MLIYFTTRNGKLLENWNFNEQYECPFVLHHDDCKKVLNENDFNSEIKHTFSLSNDIVFIFNNNYFETIWYTRKNKLFIKPTFSYDYTIDYDASFFIKNIFSEELIEDFVNELLVK